MALDYDRAWAAFNADNDSIRATMTDTSDMTPDEVMAEVNRAAFMHDYRATNGHRLGN